MDERHASQIAEAFMSAQDLRGYSVKLSHTHLHPTGPWGAVFDVYSPEGNPVDGPIVVVVDPETQTARFLDEWILKDSSR